MSFVAHFEFELMFECNRTRESIKFSLAFLFKVYIIKEMKRITLTTCNFSDQLITRLEQEKGERSASS